MEWTGLEVDEERNRAATGTTAAMISGDGGRLEAWMIPTDEELLIARDTVRLVRGLDPRG